MATQYQITSDQASSLAAVLLDWSDDGALMTWQGDGSLVVGVQAGTAEVTTAGTVLADDDVSEPGFIAWCDARMGVPTVETKVEPQSDGSFRVMTTTGSSWWGIGVDFPSEQAAVTVARTIRERS